MIQIEFLGLLLGFQLLLRGVYSVEVLLMAERLFFICHLQVFPLVFVPISQTEVAGPVVRQILDSVLFSLSQSLLLHI